MRKIIVIIVILLSTVNIYSQSNSDTTKQKPFKFYTNSFQFRILQFFSLADFQGGLISYKYHFNNHYAFRFGLGIRLDNDNQDEEKNNLIDSITTSANYDLGSYHYSLQSQLLFYVNPQNDIKLYIGLGPYLSFSKTSRKLNNIDIISKKTDYKFSNTDVTETKDYLLGVSSVYGVEWFFTKNMSLIAEYGFVLAYSNSKAEYRHSIYEKNSKINHTNSYKRSSSGFKFNSSRVNFGLSVYF
ncbi:hypothetical protein BMS3Abin04_02599 [bacterium BMS3Abin04]|nr:hypothetical protein BMS3Abin04_02599 [bacterium BMS3Abin04]